MGNSAAFTAKLAFLFMFATSHAFANAKHSKVIIKSHADKAGAKILIFTVEALEGMLLTLDAPWALKVEANPDIQMPKPSRESKSKGKKVLIFGKEKMSDKLPGFELELKGDFKKARVLEYQVEAFACTTDKSRCFKDTHQGTYKFSEN